MTRAHLFLFGLWLPLMVIAIVSIGEALLKQLWWHEMSRATGYLLLGGMMGGIQYLLFAAVVTLKFHRMDADFLARLSWVMPIMFFPICFVGLWVFFQLAELAANREQYFTAQTIQDSILATSVRFAAYGVAGSYLYVACIHGLGKLLKWLGLMREDGMA